MADETPPGATWPLPKFSFLVDFGDGIEARFQEVSGLDAETRVIECRRSNSPAFSTVKMPGIARYGSVSMKRGLFAGGNAFWKWHGASAMNNAPRRDVKIALLDERGDATLRWTLGKAWLTRVRSADLTGKGEEVAVEGLELAFERIELTRS